MSVRRQVYLPEGDDQILTEESKRTGRSVSELIRHAVQRCYRAKPRLTWDEYFADGVRVNSAYRDPWVYDPLFDDDWLLNSEPAPEDPEV